MAHRWRHAGWADGGKHAPSPDEAQRRARLVELEAPLQLKRRHLHRPPRRPGRLDHPPRLQLPDDPRHADDMGGPVRHRPYATRALPSQVAVLERARGGAGLAHPLLLRLQGTEDGREHDAGVRQLAQRLAGTGRGRACLPAPLGHRPRLVTAHEVVEGCQSLIPRVFEEDAVP